MKKFTKHLSIWLAGLLCCTCLFACLEEDESADTTTTAASTTTSTTVEPPSTDEEPVTNEQPITDEKPVTDEEPLPGEDDKQEIDNALTHAEIFAKAQEKMTELDSYTGASTIDMTMTMMGMSIPFTISETSYVDATGGRYYSITSTEMMGEASETIIYYDEEVYFMDVDGMQFKADMTSDFMEELLNGSSETADLGLEAFESYKVYSSDDGYIVEIVGLKDDLGLLDALLNAGLEGLELDLSAIELEIRLTKDFLYTEITMNMEMSMDMDEMDIESELAIGVVDVKMEMTLEYSDYNASADKIDTPDMTNAEEIDLEDLLGIDTDEEVGAEVV